jgi:hypothetical protein
MRREFLPRRLLGKSLQWMDGWMDLVDDERLHAAATFGP